MVKKTVKFYMSYEIDAKQMRSVLLLLLKTQRFGRKMTFNFTVGRPFGNNFLHFNRNLTVEINIFLVKRHRKVFFFLPVCMPPAVPFLSQLVDGSASKFPYSQWKSNRSIHIFFSHTQILELYAELCMLVGLRYETKNQKWHCVTDHSVVLAESVKEN